MPIRALPRRPPSMRIGSAEYRLRCTHHARMRSASPKFSPAVAAVRVEVTARDTDVLFRVQHQGTGIHREHLEGIFEPFMRLGTVSGAVGTGLGLYIARALVEHQGGEIWAESPGPGEGSTFSFTLPRAAPQGDDELPRTRIDSRRPHPALCSLMPCESQESNDLSYVAATVEAEPL
ncbi:MAG: ATP-binding protein [Dehalococcoidia bacterium]